MTACLRPDRIIIGTSSSHAFALLEGSMPLQPPARSHHPDG